MFIFLCARTLRYTSVKGEMGEEEEERGRRASRG